MTEKEYYPIELFHWVAMGDNHIDYIKDILSFHPEYINEKTKENYNCLMLAAQMGNFEVVKFLIEETNIDLNHKNNDGNALFYSIHHKHHNISNYLIDNQKISLDTINNKGENILHIAAQTGKSSLIEKIFFLNKKLGDLTDNNGNTPLHHLINSYPQHKSFISFSFLIDNLTEHTIKAKNKNNQSINDMISNLCHNGKILERKNNENLFLPLQMILSPIFEN